MARLLVIVSYKVFPPQMGGQKGIVHFYEHLKEHHTIVMAVSIDNEAAETGYRIEKLLFNNHRMGLNFLRILGLKRLIQEERIDAIVAEHSYTGWIAWLIKKITGVPFLIHSHNIESSRFRQMGKKGWRWYFHYEKWIHQKADFNFFKTEEEKAFAEKAFSLMPDKCSVVPYGVNSSKKIQDAGEVVRRQFNIQNQYIFYFNGTLDYKPNQDALEILIYTINPALLDSGIDYTILISGKNLPPSLLRQLTETSNILYVQYVDDVNLFYQATTLFLNPIYNDAGVKTKLVEALANGCTVISTQSGATGIPKECAGQKLITVKDGNWSVFVDAIRTNVSKTAESLPTDFFSYFSWPEIAKKAAGRIQATINHA